MTTPTFPRPDYDGDDARAWLTDPEREMLEALMCPDISVQVNVSVRLHEYRGKRPPRRGLTPEQEEREKRAGQKLRAYCWAMGAPKTLLLALAGARKEGAK
jgi:hypothetical protein